MSCLHSVIGAMTGVVTVWEMRSAMQTYEIDDETVWVMRSVMQTCEIDGETVWVMRSAMQTCETGVETVWAMQLAMRSATCSATCGTDGTYVFLLQHI